MAPKKLIGGIVLKKKFVIPMILSATILASPFASASASAQSKSSDMLASHVKAGKAEPMFVTGLKSEKFSKKNKSNALVYLQQNKKKFGMVNPEQNFKQKSVESDELGMTHVRLQQTKNGVSVEGAEVTVHYNKSGNIQSVTGYYNDKIESAPLDTEASISKDQALQTAKGEVDAPGTLEYDPTAKLVVYPFNGKHYTAYKVNVNFLGKEPGNWFVFVDANTGSVIDKYNALMHADELKASTGNGIGVKGKLRKQLHISHTTGTNKTFFLKDISHPGLEHISTYDFKNQWRSNTVRLPGDLYAGNDASFRDKYDAAAVDAHYNSEEVYHYFKDKHGRNSIDGNGGAIISSVHYGVDYNNAFWNGVQMTYGDGDGKFFIPLSAALDVAAHEMTHGVTTNTANLLYRNQSGALNEAFSDIFGALVDDDDWEVGEDAMAPQAILIDGRKSLRSLSQPDKYPVNVAYVPYGNGKGMYPKHMDEFYNLPLNLDNGGVHINSSIINHAAYLTGIQIGKEKLGKIYYRALTTYLGPNSNFSDARRALIQSAVDIYGAASPEAQATEDGYNQVGITE